MTCAFSHDAQLQVQHGAAVSASSRPAGGAPEHRCLLGGVCDATRWSTTPAAGVTWPDLVPVLQLGHWRHPAGHHADRHHHYLERRPLLPAMPQPATKRKEWLKMGRVSWININNGIFQILHVNKSALSAWLSSRRLHAADRKANKSEINIILFVFLQRFSSLLTAQSTLQYVPHSQAYTDDGGCHARCLFIRSSLGFSILLKDTSTCSEDEPVTLRSLVDPLCPLSNSRY